MDAKELLDEINGKLKMNLQYFATDGDDEGDLEGSSGKGTEGDHDEDDDSGDDDSGVELPKTEEELQTIINASVEARLARENKKHKAELEAERKKIKADAERYAQMSDKEKKQAEIDDRIKKLEEKEAELNNRELLSEIKSDLTEKELPLAFAEPLLTIQDNEKIKEAIIEIKTTWDDEITEAKKASIRQSNPRGSSRSYNSDSRSKSKREFFDSGRKIK